MVIINPGKQVFNPGKQVFKPDKLISHKLFILSVEMMLRYMGWTESADLILKGLNGAIGAKRVTYDFARLMDGATEIKCSEFGSAVIEKMKN